MNEIVSDEKSWRSRHGFNGHAVVASGNTFGQKNFPSPFILIHAQFHASRGGRMIYGLLHQKKIRSKLLDGQTKALTKSRMVTRAECPPRLDAMSEEAFIQNARAYVARRQSQLVARLGFGIHGIIYVARNKSCGGC